MIKSSHFIGRENEQKLLHTIIKKNEPTIGVVYGRRRVGKTVLVKKAFSGKKLLTFEGLENRPKQEQIYNFLFQLSYQTEFERPVDKITSWKEVFILYI